MTTPVTDPLIAEAPARSRRRLPPILVSLSVLYLLGVAMLVIAPGVAPHDPDRIDALDSLRTADSEHWFGTDQLGRDVFSRVIAGARTAFLAPLVLAVCVIVIGTALGIAAGMAGRWVDAAVNRTVEVLYSIPALVVAIIVVGVTGGGFTMAVAVLMVFGIPSTVRIMRAAVVERMNLPYIEAARTLGMSGPRIVFAQVLPALVPLIVTAFFLQFTYGIVEVASMSFLGLGVPPGSPDWGRMMFENRAVIGSNVWATAAPGLFIVALAVAANVVGDWVFARFEAGARER